MKRISKRELMMRFPVGQTGRAEVLQLGRRQASVRVNGVKCIVSIPTTVRDSLLGCRRINATTRSTPRPLNRGWFAPGTVPPTRHVLDRSLSANKPTLQLEDPAQSQSSAALLAYTEAHPVGCIVWAVVLRSSRSQAKLQLVGGPVATLDAGACHDHTPGEGLRRLALPDPGQRLRVVVRQYRHSQPRGLHVQVQVSLHSWQRDQSFCNQEAGYKNRFDIERSHFAHLPWEQPKT